jgi:E3 SUMO-protein ligase PIAS1
MASGQTSELQSVIALVKTLTNAQLKDILRDEGLAVSGLKAALQVRIINALEGHFQAGRLGRYDSLRKFIYATAHRSMPPSPSIPPPVPGHYCQQIPTTHSVQSHHRQSPLGMSVASHGSVPGPLIFKDSPFYRIIRQLTPTIECKGENIPWSYGMTLIAESST